jgi:hypothetical protein
VTQKRTHSFDWFQNSLKEQRVPEKTSFVPELSGYFSTEEILPQFEIGSVCFYTHFPETNRRSRWARPPKLYRTRSKDDHYALPGISISAHLPIISWLPTVTILGSEEPRWSEKFGKSTRSLEMRGMGDFTPTLRQIA